MTKINGKKYHGAVDILVGGTPCQDFSVAGKRAGISGERSGLALEFIRLAHEISPRWIVWENVPGCLSTNRGSDFASFTQALAECGYHLAYRVLDAQFFGSAMRRRRVFLVGSLGNSASAQVLFGGRESDDILLPREATRDHLPSFKGVGGGISLERLPHIVFSKGQFRKLTPLEWERCFGFPDGYTWLPGASDTARYEALGNSMAVPVMRWIGERIQKWNDEYGIRTA